jgi:hypothetical protein
MALKELSAAEAASHATAVFTEVRHMNYWLLPNNFI